MGHAAVKLREQVYSIKDGEDYHYDVLCRAMRENCIDDDRANEMLEAGEILFGYVDNDGDPETFRENKSKTICYASLDIVRDGV